MAQVTGATDFFADPLGGLTEHQWDELARDRFYSSAFWLRLCDFEWDDACGGIHVTLSGGGRAAVPVIAVGENPHPNCRWGELLAELGLPSPPERGILVGQRRGYLTHLLASPGADPATAAGAVLEAVRTASPPVPHGPSAQVAMYLTTPDVLALREAGVRSAPVLLAADAWIEMPPRGWEAWLGSSHRRRRILNEVHSFERAGYRVEHRTLRGAYLDVARLTVHTQRRYGAAADVDGYAEAFRMQGEWAGSRAEVLLCSYGDEQPVGCCLFYRDGHTVYLRAAGFDYERLRGAAEYFNLGYYIPARMPGVRWLHAGIGSPDAKALRGAELRPLWLVDLSRTSVLEQRADEVRAHNAAFRRKLSGCSPVVAAAMRSELWDAFS